MRRDHDQTSGRGGIKSFLLSRSRGEVLLATVFWRDMILFGTAINIAAAFTALMLLAAEFSTPVVLSVFFAPMPWNLFLVFSVWRSGKSAPAESATITRVGAALWFALALMI